MSKLTLHAIPTEVLDRIFQNLTRRDLFQCQKVCRFWYSPAHLLILQKVCLMDNSNVDSFLDAMNENPSYLKFVKQLELGDREDKGWIDAAHAERLFSCLLFINDLSIIGDTTFANLVTNTDFHEIIKRSCLKLHKVDYFTWEYGAETSKSQLNKALQGTLTHLELTTKDKKIDYLSGFSQLQKLDIGLPFAFVNFQTWLPLFKQHPHTIKSILGVLLKVDSDDFMELKSKQEQQLLANNLSSLQELVLKDAILCPNSIQFILRYLKGVKSLGYTTIFTETNWSELQIHTFCGDLLDFAHCLQDCDIRVTRMNELLSTKLLPKIIRKVFYKSSQCLDGRLHININYNSTERLPLHGNLCLNSKREKISNSRVKRSANIDFMINQVVFDSIKGALSESNLNSLGFNFTWNSPRPYIPMFQQILDNLPMLKKVALYMCGWFDSSTVETPTKQYFQVDYFEMNEGIGSKRRNMPAEFRFMSIDMFINFLSMFPKIKYLKLHYFGGFFKEETNLFELPLHNLNLERLYLDVTPVLSGNQQSSNFVLCVQTNDQRYLYQISCDYLRVIKNYKDDMQDGVKVTINVASLKYINLYLYKDRSSNNYEISYIHSCIENVMEAKLSLV